MKHRVVRAVAVGVVLSALGCASSGGPTSGGGSYGRAPATYTTESTARSGTTYSTPASDRGYSSGGDVVQSTGSDDGYRPAATPPPPPEAPAPSQPVPMGPGGRVTNGTVRMQTGPASGGGAAMEEAPSRSATPLPSPQERPGLATQWGENRDSAVTFTSFQRATATPFEVASIHYNDAGWAAIQARYHGGRGPAPWFGAYHDGLRISLRDEVGRPLPGYPAGDRMYVLGQAGRRYVIVLENTTPYRFEAVVSVDGLDVINGRAASLGFRGYIVPPRGSVQIDGWRRSQSTVAAFRFGSVGESYAAERGEARNVGVVGVALYAEAGVVLQPWDMQRELDTREDANPFPGGFAPPPRRPYY